MSKKHGHNYNCQLEHMRRSFITEEQLLILISVILIFNNRPTYSYRNKCKYCSNYKCTYKASSKSDCGYIGDQKRINSEIEEKAQDAEAKSFTFKDSLYNIKSELQSGSVESNDYDDESIQENKSNIIETVIKENYEPAIRELTAKKTLINHLKVTVYNTTTLQNSPNDNLEENFSLVPVLSNIPIIISRPNLEICMETFSTFPEPIFQINDMDKHIVINECMLITDLNTLFIKGFIQESIEYSTAEYIKGNTVTGRIKKILFNIPFQYSSKIFFYIEPQVPTKCSKINLEILNINEKSYNYFESLNKKAFAEISSIKIIETDIKEDITVLENTNNNFYTFCKIKKRIIINLSLNIFENQPIFITNLPTNNLKELHESNVITKQQQS
jgi:hypothetical protein